MLSIYPFLLSCLYIKLLEATLAGFSGNAALVQKIVNSEQNAIGVFKLWEMPQVFER